jgi:hypothetical protein
MIYLQSHPDHPKNQPSPSSTVERTRGEFEAVIDHTRDAGNYPKTLIVANGKLVAVCYKQIWGTTIEKEEAEANAAYICKAVNSHETLKEALQEALNIIDRLGDEYREATNRHSSFTNGEYKRLKSALQKASQ